jgi:hypothetical protein
MSKGLVYKDALADTIAVHVDGGVVTKVSWVPPSYNKAVFQLLVDRLYAANVTGYLYTSVEVCNNTLTTCRPRIIGTVLVELENIADYREQWNAFVDNLCNACDAFAELGYGFIPREVGELHNFLLEYTDTFRMIDIETSFITCSDRQLFDQYITAVKRVMRAEYDRFIALVNVERNATTVGLISPLGSRG